MREQLNCPNCGMPIASTQCEYCGTLFYDFATLDFDKPTYVRINRAGEVLTMKARVRELTARVETNDCTYYCNDNPYTILRQPEMTLDFSMVCFPDDKGVLLERRKTDETI